MSMRDEIAHVQRTYPMQSLTVNGHEWHWLDTSGPGPEVVLLHGSAADAFMFARTMVALGERLRMVSVTIPAISDPAPFVEGLLHVLDRVDVKKTAMVGSSMGAYLAPHFAARYPERVSALLLGNGFVDSSDLTGPLFDRAYLEAVDEDTLHAEWTERIAAAPDSDLKILQQFMMSRKPPEALKAHFLMVVRAKPCPPLSLSPKSITVLTCEDDPVISASARRRAEAQFPGARMVSMEAGGHYPHVLNPGPYQALLRSVCE